MEPGKYDKRILNLSDVIAILKIHTGNYYEFNSMFYTFELRDKDENQTD